MAIHYIPEHVSSGLISHELAMEATTAAYIAAAESGTATFPVVVGHDGNVANRFSIKSASTAQYAGVKIGSYWPDNIKSGSPRHNSCILLFDQTTGKIDTLIEAGIANAYRTAAGNAIAVKYLAREDASHLAIFGAGHQAHFECEAVMRVRAIRKISIVNRSLENGRRLAEKLGGVQIAFSDAEEACKRADIIVTATAARNPLFKSAWVRPGTHISCMGADSVGKQELPADLLVISDLYCDFVPQSTRIGEFQHVAAAIDQGMAKRPINIGEVLSGLSAGRRNAEVVTIFDSSGLALQDLQLARCLLREAAHRQLVLPLRSEA